MVSKPKFISTYNDLVLRQPVTTLIALTLMIVYFLLYIPDFELDASAESLVLENDSSLKYYRGVRERYGADDFLIVTYSPEKELFSPEVIADIKNLREELVGLEHVASVTSMLDVILGSAHWAIPGPVHCLPQAFANLAKQGIQPLAVP